MASIRVIPLLLLALGLAGGTAAQEGALAETFQRSDVALWNTSGKPQLVEFYHPT